MNLCISQLCHSINSMNSLLEMKLAFLERFLPIIKDLGATGLLIEYEDMFPYSGEIVNISAGNAYPKEDLKVISLLPFYNCFVIRFTSL